MKNSLRTRVGVVAKFLATWTWLTISLASGGPALVVAVWFLSQGKEVPRSGLWTILQACSVLAAWAAWFQEYRSHDDQREFPRLQVATGDFHRINGIWREQYYEADTMEERTTRLSLGSLVLDIENDPIHSTTKSIATAISPRLTFFCDLTGERLFELEGRWSDSVEPPQLPKDRTPTELKTTSIPIGAKRRLDLVMKYANEAVCYGVNNDSYGYNKAPQSPR
jgi:hypothetical protein